MDCHVFVHDEMRDLLVKEDSDVAMIQGETRQGEDIFPAWYTFRHFYLGAQLFASEEWCILL